jgi:Sulfotransferase family
MQGKHGVHFLHIGKTGGTAINHALAPYRETARYVIKRHGHNKSLRDIPDGEGVIFFLRNPLTRFTSGFNSRLRRGEPRAHNPWSAAEEEAFSRFDTPNRLATALSSDDDEVRQRARAAMQSIEHVRDSFWKWFESEEYFLSRMEDIFFIGFQENLSQDFETVKLKLGLPQSVTLPSDDVLAHRNPSHLDKTLDDRALENLKRWYAEDIKFYVKCKSYAERISQRDPHFALLSEATPSIRE